ncbi:general secretion pathway protein G [Caballeronia choica]|uniref:General secretion pathway protein G n=1 Tax=Caballeronia choica TaxID=326476 RepID=A0A158L221_9BURK|nr:general secretion pathway protein G [Caballeronia choica]
MQTGTDSRRFTLTKIMVAVAIFGLLAALIVSKIVSGPDEAKRVAAKQDIGAIIQALKLYRRDNGRYPTQEQGLRALIEKPSTSQTYLKFEGGAVAASGDSLRR